MNEWIEEFEKGIQMLDELNQKEASEAIFRELEWMKELTLDTWVAMDEQLEQRRKKEQPYRSRGTAYYELGMYEKAAAQFMNELKQLEHPMIRLYAGFSLVQIKLYDKGREHFFHVIEYSRDERASYFALCGLADISVRLKEYERAIEYYEKAIEINTHPDVVYNLGMCFFHLGKIDCALFYLEQLLRENGVDFGVYYLLGRCYAQLNELERANSAWLCALQLTSAKNDLLAIAYELEEVAHYLSAIHCYKRLLQCGYRDDSIVYGLAWNYGLIDERELSLEWFQKLFKQGRVDPTVWLSFVWLLKKWNDQPLLNKYSQQIEQFIDAFPHYESLLENGR